MISCIHESPVGPLTLHSDGAALTGLEFDEPRHPLAASPRGEDRVLVQARRELDQARTVLGLTEARYTLATDTQRLLAKAFALGELDLIARLRAENERFEAELQFTRAKLEAARAISRLNQALGVLP